MKSPNWRWARNGIAVTSLVVAGFLVTRATPLGHEQLLNRSARTFNEIARRATPSVVSITAIKNIDHKAMGFEIPLGHEQVMMGIGSGVVIRSDGYILTNHHVVENSKRITVALDEKHKVLAQVIGVDPKTDLAVIKIDVDADKLKLPVLDFGNSEQIAVGDGVLAIGTPFGLTHSVSSGIISAKGRAQMGIVDIEDFIQTDAAINPGSSGGPLLNTQGEMIGVNTAIFSQGGGFVGIGFAVPSEIAKEVAFEIMDHGYVRRGYIGLMAQDMDEQLSKHFQVPTQQQGALISQVLPKGPGDEAKMRVGDVVLSFNGKSIAGASEFKNLVGKTHAPALIPIQLMREGSVLMTTVNIREQPKPSLPGLQLAGVAAVPGVKPKPSLGLTVDEVPGTLSEALDIPPGSGAMIVDVRAGTPAFEAGLAPGDVIRSVNRKEIRTAGEFVRIANKMKEDESLVLYIQRGKDEKIFVPLKPAT